MEDADDLPPLEDMSDLVDRIKDKQKSVTKTEVQVLPSTDTKINKPKSVNKKSSEVGYGGLRKGFLFGSKSTSKSACKPKQSPSVKVDYEVKPKLKPGENLVFNEVQENMKSDQKLFGDKEWVTPDLLKNIEGNEKLFKQLSSPKFSKAVDMMQKDPKAAMEYYKDQPDVQEFFKEFYKILGTHFTKLGEKTDSVPNKTNIPQKSKEESEFEKTISNPEIRAILSKPMIQNLFTVLKSNPEEGQHLFRTAPDSLKADVQALVKAGLLSFEAMPNEK